jgi:beta-mannosidase
VQPRDGGLALVAVNDTGTAWETTAEVVRRGFAGDALAAVTLGLSVPAREAVTVPLPAEAAEPGDPAGEVLTVTATEPMRGGNNAAVDDRGLRHDFRLH